MVFHEAEGKAASPMPNTQRTTSIMGREKTRPVMLVNTDHQVMAPAMTLRGPNLSANSPPGI